MSDIRCVLGDCRASLAALCDEGVQVQAAVTSVPYLQQRQYGNDSNELGQEGTVAQYAARIAGVMGQVGEVLVPGGALWLNIGDKANGSGGAGGDWAGQSGGAKPFEDVNYGTPSFLDVPGMVLRLLLLEGWLLRGRIVWDKGKPKPESVRHVRRPLLQHEPIFLLQKPGGRMRWNASALPELGDVWHITPGGSGPAHLAPFPDELARRCVAASTLPGDTVIDPFGGSGTVARVAHAMGRNAIHLDLYTNHEGERHVI